VQVAVLRQVQRATRQVLTLQTAISSRSLGQQGRRILTRMLHMDNNLYRRPSHTTVRLEQEHLDMPHLQAISSLNISSRRSLLITINHLQLYNSNPLRLSCHTISPPIPVFSRITTRTNFVN
jgi:hypothetical protein